jgi:hypothetical protein
MVIFHPSAIPEEQPLLPAKKCEETLFTEELGGLCKERAHTYHKGIEFGLLVYGTYDSWVL